MKLLAASTILVAFSIDALAADAPPTPTRGDRQAVAQACAADAERFCANVERGGGRKMQCLRSHLPDLAPACKDGLSKLAAERKGDAGQ